MDGVFEKQFSFKISKLPIGILGMHFYKNYIYISGIKGYFAGQILSLICVWNVRAIIVIEQPHNGGAVK